MRGSNSNVTTVCAESLMRRVWTAALATLAVAALSACSGIADHSATGVATSYFQRLSHRDYAGACQLLTDSLKVKLGDCPTALKRQYDRLTSTEKVTWTTRA